MNEPDGDPQPVQTHLSFAFSSTNVMTVFSPTTLPQPSSMHCTRPLSCSFKIFRSKYSVQHPLQNLCSQPRLSVCSAISSGSKSKQHTGHSNASVGTGPVRDLDEEAFALAGEGRGLVLEDGDEGGERPAACSVLAGSSQNLSLSFSGFQW